MHFYDSLFFKFLSSFGVLMSVLVEGYVFSRLLWSFIELRTKFWANPSATFLFPGYFGESIVVLVVGSIFSLLKKFLEVENTCLLSFGDFGLLDYL